MRTPSMTSPHPHTVVRRELRRIARVRVQLDEAQAQLQAQLAAVRQGFSRRIEAYRARMTRLHDQLERFCREHREDILPPGRKTLATAFGEVSFRRSEAQIRVRDGLEGDDVCRLFKAAGLHSLVRVTEAPDKAAVRSALRDGGISAGQLRDCGLEVVHGPDRFYCKVRTDALVRVGEGDR